MIYVINPKKTNSGSIWIHLGELKIKFVKTYIKHSQMLIWYKINAWSIRIIFERKNENLLMSTGDQKWSMGLRHT